MGSRGNVLLAVRPPGQFTDTLDHIHEQQLTNVVVRLRVPESAFPVFLAGHLSQNTVFFLRPLAQAIDVVVEMVARGDKDHVRWRFSLTTGFAHPAQEKQAEESCAEGVDLDCSFPR